MFIPSCIILSSISTDQQVGPAAKKNGSAVSFRKNFSRFVKDPCALSSEQGSHFKTNRDTDPFPICSCGSLSSSRSGALTDGADDAGAASVVGLRVDVQIAHGLQTVGGIRGCTLVRHMHAALSLHPAC